VERERVAMHKRRPGGLPGSEAEAPAPGGPSDRGSSATAVPSLASIAPVSALVLALALGFGLAAVSQAAPGEEPGIASDAGPEREIDARPPPDTAAAPVELERLLQLPDGFGADVQTRGGATADKWRSRFRRAREEIETARSELARVEKELDSASESSSAWQVSAPGSDSPETSPLSFRLRQQVKDQRTKIAASERQLRALEIDADLSQVPSDWRE
jgi:hypothetical protein